MKNCEHKTERSTIVYISRATTVTRKDCGDCGQIISYRTDEIVPVILKDEIIKAFRRPDLTDEILKLEGRK